MRLWANDQIQTGCFGESAEVAIPCEKAYSVIDTALSYECVA